MRPLHARLVREAKERDPKFAPHPFDVKALERVPRITDDYRAFLVEVGRLTTGSLTIGHPADFDMTELPEDFLPFAEDDDHVFAFGHPVDRMQLAEELRERAVGAKGAERVRIEGELERLEGDGPIEIGIGTWNKHDGEITRSKDTFAYWLERMMAPKPVAPPISNRKPAAAEAPDAKITRALDLIDLLVATEKLEVDASFDENACAKKLAKCLDDAERLAEVLVDVRGVVELYATGDEIETALER